MNKFNIPIYKNQHFSILTKQFIYHNTARTTNTIFYERYNNSNNTMLLTAIKIKKICK